MKHSISFMVDIPFHPASQPTLAPAAFRLWRHKVHVCHRDLKPEHFLLARSGPLDAVPLMLGGLGQHGPSWGKACKAHGAAMALTDS